MLLLTAGVAALALIGWMFARRSHPAENASAPAPNDISPAAVLTATAVRTDFIRAVRLNGITEAVESKVILAPRLQVQGLGSLVITHLIPSGTRVKKGDLLVEFDRQAQIKAALDSQAQYRDFLEQINKKKADQAAARAHDDSALKLAEDALATAQLEIQKNEILSRIDAEKNQENLEEAKAAFKQQRETFDLKRAAEKADLRVLEIQRDRAYNAMRHSQANAEKLAIHSPLDGMAVLNTIWKNNGQGEVQEGDEVRAGQPFMQVIDPAHMQVRVRANQADIAGLRAGEDATIRLDAYPDMVFPAKLAQLSPVGMGSNFNDKLRVFVATLSIEGSDPKLMPDLSAAVDVELERIPGALVVPRDAVFIEGNRSYVLESRGGSTEKRAVRIGAMNDTEAVVESGLEAGAVVQRGNRTAPATGPPRGNHST